MPQDAYTLKYVSEALDRRLAGGKVTKISQPFRETVTLFIYTKTGTLKLNISLSAQNNGIFLSQLSLPNPEKAPPFCMLLRKYILGAQILSVRQAGFERVIYIDLNCEAEFTQRRMRLYIELMGKYSNSVLTENGTVTGALKISDLTQNPKRITFPGMKYSPPEPQDKADPTSTEQLERAFRDFPGEAENDPVEFLSSRIRGISYPTADDIVVFCRGKITPEGVRGYITGDISPCVIYEGGTPSDFAPRRERGDIKRTEDILEAADIYFTYAVTARILSEKKKRLTGALSPAIKKAEKRLGIIRENEKECEGRENERLKGELITANIWRISKGMTKFEAENYYNGGTTEISLDSRLTPSENAQRYYKKYAKLRRRAEISVTQRKETEERLDYLMSIRSNILSAETTDDLTETEEELTSLGLLKAENTKRRRAPVLSPLREYDIDGFTVYCGRNNIQNDRLLKMLSPDDMWLHTKGYRSAHVGIISDGRDIPRDVIERAAEICAGYSDGRGSDRVPVDYTLRKNVRKPKGAAAGFVTYAGQKTITVSPKRGGTAQTHGD